MILPRLILLRRGQQVRQRPDRYVVDRLVGDRYPKPTRASTPCARPSAGLSLNRPDPARLFGALFTYLCGLALAAGLLVT